MVNVRSLHATLQKKAIDELGEDPDRIQKDVDAFREWIKKSSHIKSRNDDQFLVNFLRGCKFSLERAKEKFDLYHTLKTHVPELTKNRDPLNEKVLEVIKIGVGLSLPNLESPDGPRYILVRPGCYDPDLYSAENVMKVATMVLDLMLCTDDNFVVSGQIIVLDLTGVRLAHLVKFTPTLIKKITMLQQDAAPIRQKGTHFVNMPSFAMAAFNLFKSFTNEKNKRRIFVHGSDMDALYKVVPRELFPKEYGGEAGTIQEITDNLEKTLVENRKFFIEDEQYGVDEKRRVGRPKNSESLFGVDGSFRKLAID